MHGSTKEDCAKIKRRRVSLWYLHVGTKKYFLPIRSCSSVSYIYSEFYIFIRNKTFYKGSQVRGFAIHGVCFKEFYARLDPKSVLTFVAQLSESLCLYAPLSNGSKEVQSHCPEEPKTTDFPYETFQHNTGNRSGWTEEAANEH